MHWILCKSASNFGTTIGFLNLGLQIFSFPDKILEIEKICNFNCIKSFKLFA